MNKLKKCKEKKLNQLVDLFGDIKMSKFIGFTDAHARGKTSINRKGEGFQDWLEKFTETMQIASKNGCEGILDFGDMFDAPEASYSVLDPIADIVEQYKIPIYSLYGNHNLLYRNIQSSRYTSLSHLMKRCKYFNYLDVLEGDDYIIKGYEFTHTIEEDIKNNGVFIDNKEDKWKIAIIHAMILEKAFFKDVPHVVCKDIKTNVDTFLLGHWHLPFNVKTDRSEFINIGAFFRNSINEMYINPSIILLDTTKRKYEIIKLKSAKKGEDLFDKEKFDEKKENKKSISEFLESMANVNIQGLDFVQQIKKIGESRNSEKRVIEYLLAKKEEVENEQKG